MPPATTIPMPGNDDVPTWLPLAAFSPVALLGLANGLYLEALYARAPAAFWIADAVHFVALPAIGLWWLHRRGLRLAELGLARPAAHRPWAAMAALTALVTLAYAATYGIARALAARLLDGGPPAFGYGATLPALELGRALGVVYFAASAAFAEELTYRAVPWLCCRRRWCGGRSVAVYAVGSAALFGLIHWENGAHEIAATAVVGLVACLLYVRIGNLWPFLGAHFVVDVVELW